MRETIPNEFYKQAATICDSLPEISFLEIARVLYERDKYLKENLHLVDAITGKPVENLKTVVAPLDSAELPTGLTWENPETANEIESETPNLFDVASSKRRGRCRARFVVVEGTKFGGRDLKQLLRELGIDLDIHYRKFKNAINRNTGNVIGEAMAFANVLKEHFGMKVNQFSAYDFDGKFCTVNLTNDGEKAE